MSKCVECGRKLGALDIYQETPRGLVCGECVLRPAAARAGAGRTQNHSAHCALSVRAYSGTEQAYLPLAPHAGPDRRSRAS